MNPKIASSQVAWALLTEGVTKARLEAHRIQHLVDRCMRLVESSSEKDHLYQVAGDVIQAFPRRMDQLQVALDRTALALAKMGQDFLESRLSLSDKAMVDEAVQPAFGKGQSRQSQRVADKYIQRRATSAGLTWRSHVRPMSRGMRGPALTIMAESSEGWSAEIQENWGVGDRGDVMGAHRWTVELSKDFHKHIYMLREFYTPDARKPKEWVAEMYQNWITPKIPDAKDFSVYFAWYTKERYPKHARVEMSVHQSQYSGDRHPKSIFGVTAPDPDEALAKIVDYLKGKSLDPSKIALRKKSHINFEEFPSSVRTVTGSSGLDRHLKSLRGDQSQVSPEESDPSPVSSKDRISILEQLLSKARDPQIRSLVEDSIGLLRRGQLLDEDRLKALRHKLYMHQMRGEADLFRVAHYAVR